jgi:N-acetyl-gamma-glutamyl-phosphate reductase
MSVPVAIFGASGFVGAELLRLCAGHPELEPVRLFAENRAGEPLGAVYPHLSLAYPAAILEGSPNGNLGDIALVFAALPHGESQKIAASLLETGVKLVDLGADFRLGDAGAYQRWYHEPHRAPELLGRFAYGIPELHRAAIAASQAAAAAGCYPTAAILALKPLVGLIDPDTITVDAISGVSGAGKGLKESSHFNNVDENLGAYGLLDHRHTAEMEMELGGKVLFTPHLAPLNRGILATCGAIARGPCNPLETLREAYRGEPFVQVSERPPQTKWALGSNAVHLTARYDQRTGRVLAIAALDNLGKGAAGQMIQCANLMLGLPEDAGLSTVGLWP